MLLAASQQIRVQDYSITKHIRQHNNRLPNKNYIIRSSATAFTKPSHKPNTKMTRNKKIYQLQSRTMEQSPM